MLNVKYAHYKIPTMTGTMMTAIIVVENRSSMDSLCCNKSCIDQPLLDQYSILVY